MAREKWALLLLLSLVAVSAWNIYAAQRLCHRVDAQLLEAENHAAGENWHEARRGLEKAVEIWQEAEEYTHIFIRHTEIDSCADVLYDALGSALEQNREELQANLEKLRYHLLSISRMERISFGSIF